LLAVCSKSAAGGANFQNSILDVRSNQGAKPEMGGTYFKCGCRAPLASPLATALCKIHAVLCWKIADVHGIKV